MLRQSDAISLRIDGANDGDGANRESGTWLYDGQVVHEVWIVQQYFDFYYDEGFEDAPEDLNKDGQVFQEIIARDGKVKSVGLAFHSTEEAVAKAHQMIPQGIEWKKTSASFPRQGISLLSMTTVRGFNRQESISRQCAKPP
jgi:hypothetical protein